MEHLFGEDPLQNIEGAGHVTEDFWFWKRVVILTTRFIWWWRHRPEPLRPWKLPPLREEDLSKLYRELHPNPDGQMGETDPSKTRLLMGIQARELLRQRQYLGRRVEIREAKVIGNSSFGRSVMAFVLVDVPSSNPNRHRETLRFRCYTRRKGMKEVLLRTPWTTSLRVRGELSGCGWGLGGDPLRLSRCEFQ